MGTDILIAVDGTGDFFDKTYAKDFANSHCSKIHSEWHTEAKAYSRGPSLLGMETGSLVLWMTSTAQSMMDRLGDGSRLFLCGYSRGGAAAIGAARNLALKNIPVHHLMLFDAVDRSPVPFLDRISGNVRQVSHARRDPAADSRGVFGNCGTRVEAQTRYEEEYFHCTHGGVGGTPWDTAEDDGKISELPSSATTAVTVVARLVTNPLFWPKVDRYSAQVGQALKNNVGKTGTTIAQDQAGAAASWTWMKQKLEESRGISALNWQPGQSSTFA